MMMLPSTGSGTRMARGSTLAPNASTPSAMFRASWIASGSTYRRVGPLLLIRLMGPDAGSTSTASALRSSGSYTTGSVSGILNASSSISVSSVEALRRPASRASDLLLQRLREGARGAGAAASVLCVVAVGPSIAMMESESSSDSEDSMGDAEYEPNIAPAGQSLPRPPGPGQVFIQ